MQNTNSVPFWYEELMLVMLQVRNAVDKDYLYHFRDRARGFIHALFAADVIDINQYNLLSVVCENAKSHAIKDISRASI